MTGLFPPKQPLPPLAEQMRPQVLEDIIGQDHLTGPKGILPSLFSLKRFPSLIFWGPPGCGKTTLARLIAKEIEQNFTQLSAVFAGVADLRRVFEQANHSPSQSLSSHQSGTVLFIDEIHRFNKSQQDALLGPMESGLITLIGATTENPSFALNAALLSRARVLTIHRLDEDALHTLLKRVELKLGVSAPLTLRARYQLVHMADGDGRMLLNLLESLLDLSSSSAAPLDAPDLSAYLQKRAVIYDKSQDNHYNLISAFIKSMRGSDPNAALYWMARLLTAGEDPLYVGRRMVRFAAEDIGLADPHALTHAVSACSSYERLGSPEGDLALANAAVYLATAPKSNAVYTAFNTALKMAKNSGSLTPPFEILNAPTALMKEQGYGEGYRYDHDCPHGFSGQNYFPPSLGRPSFYNPVERGYERDVKKRLDFWKKLKTSQKKT